VHTDRQTDRQTRLSQYPLTYRDGVKISKCVRPRTMDGNTLPRRVLPSGESVLVYATVRRTDTRPTHYAYRYNLSTFTRLKNYGNLVVCCGSVTANSHRSTRCNSTVSSCVVSGGVNWLLLACYCGSRHLNASITRIYVQLRVYISCCSVVSAV